VADLIHQRASVADLHGIDPFEGGPPEPQVWWCDPMDAAVVLGSRQSDDMLDVAACRAAGLSIVRRRSGGGAVIVRPDAVVWIDVIVPRGMLSDDIRVSMVQIGEIWLAALRSEMQGRVDELADAADMEVHRGGMVGTPWSDLVCFAGLGPGEITIRGSKLVGLSQRRTRHGARVQGSVYTRPVTREIVSLLGDDTPRVELPEPWSLAHLDARSLAERLTAQLAVARLT